MPIEKLDVVINAKDNFSAKATGVSNSFGIMTKAAMAAGAALAVVFTKQAIESAIKFEDTIANLQTLYGDNKVALDQWTQGLKDLQKVIPQDPDDLGASSYAIVSAGITDTSEALDTLLSSGKLATAGLGSMQEATNLMTAAINNFRAEGLSAAEISDTLFKTVRAGKTTVAELSQAFGSSAPAAVAAGASFNEFQAATAALTTASIPTAEAQTKLRALFDELTRTTGKTSNAIKDLGISNTKAKIESDGFKTLLDEMYESVGRDDIAFKNMFSSVEAGTAAMLLVNATSDAYNTTLADMESATVAIDEAFKAKNETTKATYQLFKNNLNVAMMELGTVVLPFLTKAIEYLTIFIVKSKEAIEKFGGVFVAIFETIKEVVGTIIEWLTKQFNDLISLIERLIKKLQFWKSESASAGASGSSGGGSAGNVSWLSGARANGGAVAGGSSYLVGERGAEIFTPSTNGMITPNNKIGSTIVFNFNGAITDRQAAEWIGDMMLNKLKTTIKVA